MRSYLEDYCDHFGIRRHIRFETKVELVEPIGPDPDRSYVGKKWRVRYRDLKSDREDEELFDAVFVCSGHYSDPNFGEIENIGSFKVRKIFAARSTPLLPILCFNLKLLRVRACTATTTAAANPSPARQSPSWEWVPRAST